MSTYNINGIEYAREQLGFGISKSGQRFIEFIVGEELVKQGDVFTHTFTTEASQGRRFARKGGTTTRHYQVTGFGKAYNYIQGETVTRRIRAYYVEVTPNA